ncbi:uncharacterized protein [Zea mays]|uniref:DNA polymerase V family n=1 Tax=Zea mays TaxID=4577 RepID=A0A1D6MTN5_MAIZE|nr:uncharacterized protein LOC103650372 [Zea mays]ONM32249.1 DNA polymerase V family [Zea mays]|eukprot:XP_008674178.1 uncharacterized protein LOC103650372 isoform X2 [Zea mays]
MAEAVASAGRLAMDSSTSVSPNQAHHNMAITEFFLDGFPDSNRLLKILGDFKEVKTGPGLESTWMHAMRYLLIQLLLQVLLHPDEYWEATFDVAICCKKSFPVIAQGDNSCAQEFVEHGIHGLHQGHSKH